MRWRPGSVAARLCSAQTGTPADPGTSRRPPRSRPRTGCRGAGGEKRAPGVSSASLQSLEKSTELSQVEEEVGAVSTRAGSLPDLVPSDTRPSSQPTTTAVRLPAPRDRTGGSTVAEVPAPANNALRCPAPQDQTSGSTVAEFAAPATTALRCQAPQDRTGGSTVAEQTQISLTDSEYVVMRPVLPLFSSRDYENLTSGTLSCDSDDSAPTVIELRPAPVVTATGKVPKPSTQMGELNSYSPGGSKRHMSAGSSATMRNDAKAVVKSAKISTTSKVNKGEAEPNNAEPAESRVESTETTNRKPTSASRCSESNKENAGSRRRKKLPSPPVFGYDIDDINNFLSQATSRTPANIPMVVTSPAELYVLTPPATPEEPTVPIHLGLVVNALFKHRQWLYVQTPHNQEGYLAYSSCTPLGIIPRVPTAAAAAAKTPWEHSSDIYVRRRDLQSARRASPPSPPPSCQQQQQQQEPQQQAELDPQALDVRVNKTDTEKLYENVTSDGRALGLLLELRQRSRSKQRVPAGPRCHSAGRQQPRRGQQPRRRDRSEPGWAAAGQTAPNLLGPGRSQPSAFHPLKPAAGSPPVAKPLELPRRAEPPAGRSHLVAPRSNNKAVIWEDFNSRGRHTLTVRRGDIVILLNTSMGEWFWVKDSVGREGYIPSACVGSGLN